MIEALFVNMKPFGGEIIVEFGPQDYETVNIRVFEIRGYASSTVETTM